MSYNGTVTCSHCYRQGHNRRKCERLNDSIKAHYLANMTTLAEYRDNTSEHTQKMSEEDRAWYVQYYTEKAESHRQEYIKRTKIDLSTGKKVTNKAAKAKRMKNVTCGYCGRNGHTRRTCQNVKNDYAIFAARTRELRQQWLEDVKEGGYGIGTMVIKDTHGYDRSGEWGRIKVTGLVTAIDWRSIHAHSDSHCFEIQTNDQMAGRDVRFGQHFNNMSVDSFKRADGNGFETVGSRHSVIPSGRAPNPPKGWLDDMPPIKEVFNTKEGRSWGYSNHVNDAWQSRIREELGLPPDAHAEG